ncbi:hypothetical protein [Kineosporia mesophila]|nr:hypothetical protein [Kineosporia mesophila]MCD5353237.1 hypothetical protein [Kineosporia mesophila]
MLRFEVTDAVGVPGRELLEFLDAVSRATAMLAGNDVSTDDPLVMPFG